ncbi:ATP-binding protein [Actinomadura viridis]|uniref:ATP-binding protein n=1 Tax=Actinomadura viridis TaxID=58110 RepID=UPI003674308A
MIAMAYGIRITEESYKRDVPALPVCVGLLRECVESRLLGWGVRREAVDDALLVISELVTNGVAACPDTVLGFEMYVSGFALVIEITDTSPDPLVRRTAGDYDVSGRGLDIVDALAESWGMRRLPQRGKCVWARLALKDS